MWSQPHARRGGDALAGRPGRGRNLHGLRHRSLPRLRRTPGVRRLRPRVQSGSRLPRRGPRVGDAAGPPEVRDQRMTIDMSVEVDWLELSWAGPPGAGEFV